MTTFAIVVFGSLMAFVVVQAGLVAGFVGSLARFSRPRLADVDCPRAAVVLCLRGGDPFLPACIDALLNQDYPRYDVHIIVDSSADPAAGIVDAALRQHSTDNVHVHVLREPKTTCSLKCSSLVQVVRDLAGSCDVMAQLDADVVPHATWLRELVAPLKKPHVGAATGNRWYMPGKPTWGSMIRYFWNSAAVVQMYWYRIAWGGTLAVKTQVFHESKLLERWSQAFCEDTMLFRELKTMGLEIEFVPSLMMINRETCDTSGFFRWVRRQLLTARLYHPRWFLVAGHGILTSLLPAIAVGLAVAGWMRQQDDVVLWCVSGLAAYQLALLPAPLLMERFVRRIARARHESDRWLTAAAIWKWCWALPMTQVVYAGALLSSLTLRRVAWRGVTYRIQSAWRVRLEEYRPYSNDDVDQTASL